MTASKDGTFVPLAGASCVLVAGLCCLGPVVLPVVALGGLVYLDVKHPGAGLAIGAIGALLLGLVMVAVGPDLAVRGGAALYLATDWPLHDLLALLAPSASLPARGFVGAALLGATVGAAAGASRGLSRTGRPVLGLVLATVLLVALPLIGRIGPEMDVFWPQPDAWVAWTPRERAPRGDPAIAYPAVLVGDGTNGLWVGVTEVTQERYEAVVGDNPSHCPTGCGPDLPVQQVTWLEAVFFANALSERWGLQPAYRTIEADRVEWDHTADGWRLPTSEEWSLVAAGGGSSRFAGGDDADAVAWHDGNAGQRVHPVGKRHPNAFGLHDMSGNVWEWTWDPHEPGTRTLRGGGALSPAELVSVDARHGLSPKEAASSVGFRLVRSAHPAGAREVTSLEAPPPPDPSRVRAQVFDELGALGVRLPKGPDLGKAYDTYRAATKCLRGPPTLSKDTLIILRNTPLARRGDSFEGRSGLGSLFEAERWYKKRPETRRVHVDELADSDWLCVHRILAMENGDDPKTVGPRPEGRRPRDEGGFAPDGSPPSPRPPPTDPPATSHRRRARRPALRPTPRRGPSRQRALARAPTVRPAADERAGLRAVVPRWP